MVAGGGDSRALQPGAYLLHFCAGGAVNNAAAVPALPQQRVEGGRLVFGMLHVEKEVWTVEPRHQNRRLLQAQQADDVLPDFFRGGGGKSRQHRPLRELCEGVGDGKIARAEILPPLGDAVRLVHRRQRNLQPAHHLEKALVFQPFGRGVNELIFAPAQSGADPAVFVGIHGAVEECRGNPRFFQRGHLVLHQRNQRGYDQRQPRKKESGDLIAEGFPAAGGHDPEAVPAGQDAVDQLFLPAAERTVSEIFSDNGVFVHRTLPCVRRSGGTIALFLPL